MTVQEAKQRAIEARLAEELKNYEKEQARTMKTLEKGLRRKRAP
jgi:hypothetical protein